MVGCTVIDMTADYYGWFTVYGPQAILTEGTLVLGHNCMRSDSTAGAVEPSSGSTLVNIGQVMTVNPTTEYSLVWMDV